MLDSHCHLDRFRDPMAVARRAAREDTFVIAVTNLPSHFVAAIPHVRKLPNVRLALGLHPLSAADHAAELRAFDASFARTSFIGEVGLDFSSEGHSTRHQQVETFRYVAKCVARSPKFMSLHSRRAETAVLDILDEMKVGPAVFHWFSGPLTVLNRAIESGHYFSLNPAMLRSANGRRIIERIPKDRVLTESDGPHVLVKSKPCNPWEVALVNSHLSSLWGVDPTACVRQVWGNFMNALSTNGLGKTQPAADSDPSVL